MQLQYYVEKFNVNDVIFPSGCEAPTINLGNKNVKIGIFTGGTSVRSKNIFIDISRYPIRKHKIKFAISAILKLLCANALNFKIHILSLGQGQLFRLLSAIFLI